MSADAGETERADDRAAGDTTGSDRAAGDRAATDPAATDPAASDRAGGDRKVGDPDLRDSRDRGPAVRLRQVLLANLIAIWGSVLVLLIMRVTFTTDRGLTSATLILAAGGLGLLAAAACARRNRTGPAAMLIIVSNWIPAIGVAYFSPFTLPVALFGLLVPVVLLLEFLAPRALAAVTVVTVVSMAALAGLVQWRHDVAHVPEPETPITASLLTLFVLIIVGVLMVGLRQHTRRLTEQAQALSSSRSRLASAADEARRGIERDLHDGAQQRLSTLSVRLGRVQRLLPQDPEQAQTVLKAAHADLHEAIRELRDLAHGIYPMLLEQRGLGQALSAAARRATRPTRVQAAGLGRYPAPVENAVYFCCLEAMHNADRHSGAATVTVRLAHDDDALAFSVSDDGVGFDPRTVNSRGLTGMVDRVRAAGGTLGIDSAPGAGTVVSGRIPAPVIA